MRRSSKAASPDRSPVSNAWMQAADLAATFLFAVEGARAAAQANLDVFGLVVVAFATALGGGLLRDLILGENPPAAFRSAAYFGVAIAGAEVVFVASRVASEVPAWTLVTLDAAAAGAAVCVLFLRTDRRRNWPMLVGAIVCFTVRMVSWAQAWNLPQVIG